MKCDYRRFIIKSVDTFSRLVTLSTCTDTYKISALLPCRNFYSLSGIHFSNRVVKTRGTLSRENICFKMCTIHLWYLIGRLSFCGRNPPYVSYVFKSQPMSETKYRIDRYNPPIRLHTVRQCMYD